MGKSIDIIDMDDQHARYSSLSIHTIWGQYIAASISTIVITLMTWHEPDAFWTTGASIGILAAPLPTDCLLGILLRRKPLWISPIVITHTQSPS